MKVKINTHGGPLPVKHGEWVDLYAGEDISMKKDEFRIISLGVKTGVFRRCASVGWHCSNSLSTCNI